MDNNQQTRVDDNPAPEVKGNLSQSQSVEQNPKQSFSSKVGLIVIFTLIIVGIAGYMFFQNKLNKEGKISPVPVNTNSSSSALPTSVSTSSSELSKDDSLNTLKKELKDTSIDDFSSDLQDVKNDVDSL